MVNDVGKEQGPEKQTGRRKILFVCPSLATGGAEKLLLDLVSHIDRSRFSVSLALFQNRGEWKTRLPRDVALFHLHKKNRFDFIKLIVLLAFSVFPSLRPDTVISFLWYANVVTLLARLITPYSCQCIISEHTSTALAPSYQHRLVKRLFSFLYLKADRIVTVTNGLQREIAARYHVPAPSISVIHNCVDLSAIREHARSPISDWPPAVRKGPVILGCGRLNDVKDFPFLIRAFSLLPGQLNARLYIIGEGEERRPLEKLVRFLNLEKRVFFLGYRKNPYTYMGSADVFALTSRYEGFGTVIVEAMACGTAVVAMDCPFGPREIITDGVNGLLVPRRDQKLFAQSIERVLDDRLLRERLERGGLVRAAQFDVSVIVRRYERLFE